MCPPMPTEDMLKVMEAAILEKNTDELQHVLNIWQSDDCEPLQPVLCAAIRRGQVSAVDIPLSHGCRCELLATRAAFCGQLETRLNVPVFEGRLKHGWDINDSLDHQGDVSNYVLRYGGADSNDLARWLLEHGADPARNSSSLEPNACATYTYTPCFRLGRGSYRGNATAA